MPETVTTNEEAQLAQTVQMFEVITQSQPLDCQSLEILKEAYYKLGREDDAVNIAKRIAEAYISLGLLSSAILEYEGILQRFPDDPDVRKALDQIESRASNVTPAKPTFENNSKERKGVPAPPAAKLTEKRIVSTDIDDGRLAMEKLFVEGKLVSPADFKSCWPLVDPAAEPKQPLEPFIQVLAERQLVTLETSLKLLIEKTRLGYMPLDKYDVDMELARGFPRDICQRWCIVPFDRMSKSILIATANPFNRQAVADIENFIRSRLLWYLASPPELVKTLRKVFR